VSAPPYPSPVEDDPISVGSLSLDRQWKFTRHDLDELLAKIDANHAPARLAA